MSYKGGWTYLNPAYKDKVVGVGKVYDVNSMYPWAMRNCLLPYGPPIYFYGKPEKKQQYPLYIIQLECCFELKPNHYPSIQLKHTMRFSDNEYIEFCEEPILLTLTNIDYELFKENYYVYDEVFLGGYYFTASSDMFTPYIDYWYSVKEQADREGNAGMKTIAKFFLNSLYGKFGMRLKGKSKIPFFDDKDDIVRYRMTDEEDREGVYLPVATFVTSYCRDKIIRAANNVYDRFVYADTDSIHLLGTEPVTTIDIDQYRLGAFKEESQFKRARFVRQKTYYEVDLQTDNLMIKCAGMPDAMKATVREEDFYNGAEFKIGPGSRFAPKLSPKTVSGGVILREMPFKIH